MKKKSLVVIALIILFFKICYCIFLYNFKYEEFKNKKFVITGTFDGMTREEIKEYIELHGGLTSESVSKKTDVVLVGENPGSKRDKAIELNIPIWNQEKLYEIIGDTGNKE